MLLVAPTLQNKSSVAKHGVIPHLVKNFDVDGAISIEPGLDDGEDPMFEKEDGSGVRGVGVGAGCGGDVEDGQGRQGRADVEPLASWVSFLLILLMALQTLVKLGDGRTRAMTHRHGVSLTCRPPAGPNDGEDDDNDNSASCRPSAVTIAQGSYPAARAGVTLLTNAGPPLPPNTVRRIDLYPTDWRPNMFAVEADMRVFPPDSVIQRAPTVPTTAMEPNARKTRLNERTRALLRRRIDSHGEPPVTQPAPDWRIRRYETPTACVVKHDTIELGPAIFSLPNTSQAGGGGTGVEGSEVADSLQQVLQTDEAELTEVAELAKPQVGGEQGPVNEIRAVNQVVNGRMGPGDKLGLIIWCGIALMGLARGSMHLIV